jgi:hypothetical protein
VALLACAVPGVARAGRGSRGAVYSHLVGTVGKDTADATAAFISWTMAGFDHEEATLWLDGGASPRHADLCAKFRDAGVPPEIAFAQLYRRGRQPASETLFDLMAYRHRTIDDVMKIIRYRREKSA